MGDCFGGVQAFGACLGAVHNRVTAVQLERVFQIVQTLARGFVTAVNDPAIGMQQGGWPKVAIAVPPIRRARRRATSAHHTFIQAVQLFTVVNRLLPFFGGAVCLCLKPRHDRRMLRIKMGQIGNQIFDDRHMRQRIDFHIAFDFIHAINTGQRVDPVDIHRARPTNTFTARPTERQRWVNLVLDLDQRVQNHRTTGVHINKVGIQRRIFAIIGVPAVNLHLAQIGCALGFRPCLPNGHPGIFRECQLHHCDVPSDRGALPRNFLERPQPCRPNRQLAGQFDDTAFINFQRVASA